MQILNNSVTIVINFYDLQSKFIIACTAIKNRFRHVLNVEIFNVCCKMPVTGTRRYVVNSFRFVIRRIVRIAFRAFFVVQGRVEGGVSTGIYPERRSRFTE